MFFCIIFILIVVNLMFGEESNNCGMWGFEHVCIDTQLDIQHGLSFDGALQLCKSMYQNGTIGTLRHDHYQSDLDYAVNTCAKEKCFIYREQVVNEETELERGYIDTITENYVSIDNLNENDMLNATLCTSTIDICNVLGEELEMFNFNRNGIKLAGVYTYQSFPEYLIIENETDSSEEIITTTLIPDFDKLLPEVVFFSDDYYIGVRFVAGDMRRSNWSENTFEIKYAIDSTDPPINSSLDLFINDLWISEIQDGIEDWVDSTDECSEMEFNGYVSTVGIGLDDIPDVNIQVADITYDGFVNIGLNRNTLGRAYIYAFEDDQGNYTDIDNNGYVDQSFCYVRLNGKTRFFLWSGDESTNYDVYSVALHETGHCLGLDHYGQVVVYRDEMGVIRLLTQDASMAAFYIGKVNGLFPLDEQAFCGLWDSWPEDDTSSSSSSSSD